MTTPHFAPPPSPRAPRRDAALNRTAILDAAAVLLNQDSGSSLSAIAAEAGLTRRAVYGHFETRDDLILALLTRGAERIAANIHLDSVDSANGDSREAIARLGALLWREIGHVQVMAQFAVRGPFMAVVGEALAPLRLLLREVVERGIAAGQLRTDLEASLLARLIEGAALAVLDEATRTPLEGAAGAHLVMTASLGMAGLSWAESTTVVTRVGYTE
ncbi:MAG TPA: TetR family transcriptional regulator [Glaciihabitans sp.]|nr:TetR family transcriptional regulator [Glaciihabitans sp.]